MNNAKTPITGIVDTDSKTYVFYLNDYSVKFLDTVTTSHSASTIKPVDGFMQAMSHNNHKLLVYIGQHNFSIVNTMNLGISSYIVSTSNVFDYDLSFYDGIVFVGGTLAKLKHPHAMKIVYDKEHDKKYLQYSDDKQQFTFATDDLT